MASFPPLDSQSLHMHPIPSGHVWRIQWAALLVSTCLRYYNYYSSNEVSTSMIFRESNKFSRYFQRIIDDYNYKHSTSPKSRRSRATYYYIWILGDAGYTSRNHVRLSTPLRVEYVNNRSACAPAHMPVSVWDSIQNFAVRNHWH